MRSTVIIAGLATLVPAGVAAQQDTESRIAHIRTAYAAVQAGLEGYRQAEKPYYYGDGEGLVTSYSDAGGIRKLVVRFDRDGYSGLSEYFFEDGALFFAFVKDETFQIWPDQDPSEFGVTENRYYFAGNRLIRWLLNSHSEDMRQREVSPDDDEHSARGRMVLEDASTWADYSRSDVADYEAFLDARRNR